MPKPEATTEVSTEILADTSLESMYQVILFNDNHNTMPHVVVTLMRVFGHTQPLAVKIMHEAHNKGRAIAEVEAKVRAIKHKQQLESAGLTASVEPVC